MTVAPSADAGASIVTVPAKDAPPTGSFVGLRVTELMPGGSTVSVAVFVTKTPRDALISTGVVVETGLVVIGKEKDIQNLK